MSNLELEICNSSTSLASMLNILIASSTALSSLTLREEVTGDDIDPFVRSCAAFLSVSGAALTHLSLRLRSTPAGDVSSQFIRPYPSLILYHLTVVDAGHLDLSAHVNLEELTLGLLARRSVASVDLTGLAALLSTISPRRLRRLFVYLEFEDFSAIPTVIAQWSAVNAALERLSRLGQLEVVMFGVWDGRFALSDLTIVELVPTLASVKRKHPEYKGAYHEYVLGVS